MIEPAHSRLGPSSAERWMVCPASVEATKGLPDTDSAYTLEGSAAHELAEYCRKFNISTDDYTEKYVVVTGADGKAHEIEVTTEMRTHVQAFIDYINDLDGDDLNESRVRYEKYVPGGYGTLDAAIMRDRNCVVVDLKYGKGVQKYAEHNPQLLLYALGIYLEYGYLYDFDTFTLVVFQPRLDHVDEWTVGKDYLLQWAEKTLVPAYKATLDPKAKFVPGVPQCTFCKIKGTCKARAASVFEAVVDQFDSVDDAVGKVEAAAAAAPTLTNDEIAKCLEALPNVKAWCKAVEARAVAEVAAGRAVGSYKLVEGRANRAWGPDENDVAFKLMTAGLKESQMWDRSLISPTAAEKLLGKKHEVWKIDGLITKPKGKPTLADGSDKRPAINAVDGFDVVPEE